MNNIQNQGISTSDINAVSEKRPVPQEQMQREVDYVRAQQILTAMMNYGLISLSEFNKITELNRKTFSPLLAEIML
ncbi:TPA: SHOCT domain-containing protein [Streptococcus suis]